MASSDLTLQAPSMTRNTSLFSAPATRISWTYWSLWLIGFGVFSMIMPRDASYDVVHYHLHNGWSALAGEGAENLAPAELHSFLNPAWQIFIWGLIEILPGRLVAFILGALQGLGLPVLYALTRRVLLRTGAKPALLTVMAIAVAGFTAESQFGMVATVRNDAVFATALLAALALIIPDDRPAPSLLAWALASALVGSMMGIKLTNAVYVAFFAPVALILMPDWATRLKAGAVCIAAGLAGIILFAAPWGAVMWETFGNPIFPNLNAYFDAPMGPDSAFRDTRMLPDSLTETFLRPFLIFFDGALVNEAFVHFVDPRLQFTYLCCFAIPAIAIFAKQAEGGAALRPALALAAGAFIGITAWTLMFSFARYMAAAWIIGPTLLALTMALVRPRWFEHSYAPHASLAASALLFAVTSPAELRRVSWDTWTEPYVTASLPAGEGYSDAIVAFTGAYPGAFLSPYFPDETLLTHLVPQDWSAPALENYRAQIRDQIRAGERPLYVVIVDVETHFEETLTRLAATESIAVNVASCKPIKTSLGTPDVVWRICPAALQSE